MNWHVCNFQVGLCSTTDGSRMVIHIKGGEEINEGK